jgi:extracellular factor (EF) 3-hydroxypalmitic acid methyl ester biosynthesis protein
VPLDTVEQVARVIAAGTEAVRPGALRPVARVRGYEEIEGQEGREVFFRPHRYTAADLSPLRGVVTLDVEGAVVACALHDVSQNGVAFECPEGVAVEQQQRLSIALRFDSHQAFSGEARVSSVREQDGVRVVGVSFQEFLLDVEEVLQLRQVRAWQAEETVPGMRGKRWFVPGCERYKALLAELRLLLEDAHRELSALEATLPWHVLHGPENAARTALVQQLRADFVPEVVRLTEEIDAAVRELPQGHRDPAAREWSARYVDEFLMQSPGCRRARQKPFGYPGDYEVMNFIYGEPFEGASLFARAVELAFWHSRSALAVRSRKDLMKRELLAQLSLHARAGVPLRILSIAAGPAQELSELLSELDVLPAPLEVVLFEQDKNALAHAWRRLEPLAQSRFPGLVRFTFLHDSIRRLLRDPALFEPFGKFDLIYSAGLMDYLQTRTGVTLCRHLVGATAAGGRLLVANMVDHAARWYLEVPLDWQLIYRTHEEMLDMGRRAATSGRVRILAEESGANPFLEVVCS